ncbi:MAG: hypothetical protein GH151_02390 [Bacteroidetes bacterium]|nr:hypothetical protein [Bacteroidota bacterium]
MEWWNERLRDWVGETCQGFPEGPIGISPWEMPVAGEPGRVCEGNWGDGET